ncbi:ribbon-helix-helix protein, CopG family [Streptomyces sp. NPDC059897]|uniref:ribbon-helix-helix protein, CopG family n=1 Tax=Streptomyces sp. NPDC059897 TaxID=3346994 RepID=UPI003649B52B
MANVRLSISLPEEQVEFLDKYVGDGETPTRSAAIQEAVKLLQEAALESDYLAAWDEWYASGDAELWEQTVGDGLDDETR